MVKVIFNFLIYPHAQSKDRIHLLLVGVEDEGQVALAAVLAIGMAGHEHTSSALGRGALAPETGDLAVLVDPTEQMQT
jgi:hypothetical protein